MTVIVDASVVAAALLSDEPQHAQALSLVSDLRERRENLYAPRLFASEMTAVLRKAVYQGRVTHTSGMALLLEGLHFGIQLVDDEALYISSFEIARSLGLVRTYDSQYIALSTRYDCELWTADLRLVNTAERQLPKIRWLGDLS